MNKGIEIAVMAVGGLSLFVVAFLGFATMSGTPLSEVAVIGNLFQTAEPVEEEEPMLSDDTEPVYTEKQVVDANLSILTAYAFEPPLTSDELQGLVVDLKTAKLAFEERLRGVVERESGVAEREELLGHQFATLEELRAELDRYEAELSMRAAEVGRDKDAGASSAKAQWSEIARLFAQGDAEEMTTRLMQFSAMEAAKILGSLDQERAAALLNALPAESWKEYVDAYSRATADGPG